MYNDLMLTLWNRCNNKCKFCYNNGYFDLPKDIDNHLQSCKDILKSHVIDDFDNIRLVGGELFFGYKFNELCEIVDIVIDLLKNNTRLSINFITNLLYEDLTYLYIILNKFKSDDLINRVSLSTSYDVFGRFTKKTESIWWKNVKTIKNTFPSLPLDIGIVMTQSFITTVTKEWLDNLKNVTRCDINFNELYTGITDVAKEVSPFKDLFPKRHDFLTFLNKLKQWKYMNGLDIGKDTNLIHYVFDAEKEIPLMRNVKIDCYENYTGGYIDSNIIMKNDIEKILGM